jgi:hypothetical protein
MRIEFRTGDVLHVITRGVTSNNKIAIPGWEIVVQTYHYSREQYENAQGKTTMRDFFSHDKKVCLDCPFSTNNGAKLDACYTHKPIQYSGFLSQLRSIGRKYNSFDDVPEYDNIMCDIAAGMAQGLYVRFGTYGEPSLLPVNFIRRVSEASKSWTGYTHQWRTNDRLALWFMASVHSKEEERVAALIGYRSFVAVKESETPTTFVHCPASKEMDYLSNCSKCGLCSGTNGKGTKTVQILEH